MGAICRLIKKPLRTVPSVAMLPFFAIGEMGGTHLEISVKFRVSTSFKWYAKPWANFLISDTAEAILHFYKNRAESTIT